MQDSNKLSDMSPSVSDDLGMEHGPSLYVVPGAVSWWSRAAMRSGDSFVQVMQRRGRAGTWYQVSNILRETESWKLSIHRKTEISNNHNKQYIRRVFVSYLNCKDGWEGSKENEVVSIRCLGLDECERRHTNNRANVLNLQFIWTASLNPKIHL